MELLKNIYFNTDKLVQNSTIKITYSGKLFENNSGEVFIHYGFGANWENVNEIKMDKTDLGFQAELTLPETDFVNFCFRNSQNDWDNNQNCNYTFSVEKPDLSLVLQSEAIFPLKKSNSLRKTYLWKKKIKLAVYKIVRIFPKIISGNYKKNLNQN